MGVQYYRCINKQPHTHNIWIRLLQGYTLQVNNQIIYPKIELCMTKRLLLLSFFTMAIFALVQAQVAIGTPGNPPHASAMLDVQSTTKGMLVPRMTYFERIDVVAPAKGLMVYDSSFEALYVYRNDVNKWTQIGEALWKSYNGNVYYENGNVGIRTLTPDASLHIKTGNPINNISYGYTLLGDAAAVNLSMSNKEIQARIGEFTSSLILQPLGSDVHIGPPTTESPSTSLFIPFGNEAGLDDLNSGYLMMGRKGGANLVMDNNDIQARTNGNVTTLNLQSLGGILNVGGDAIVKGKLRVGNTSLPVGYSFGVDGKMICEEVQVKLKTDWADYVFAPNYALRPLHQVADFIKQNNHLPGVPAAASIAKDGLSIGEMQKLQMEKIEELTLYILQLKEEIELLKKQ
jgi:hypothetical protein